MARKTWLIPPCDTGGMKVLVVVSLVILAGCNAPTGYFRAVPPTRIAVNGSVFDVRARGTLAEAVRVNPQYAPRFGPIRTRAGLAMALISGCSVSHVLGDQARALGRLDCPKPRSATVRVARACRRVTAAGAQIPAYRCRLPPSADGRASHP